MKDLSKKDIRLELKARKIVKKKLESAIKSLEKPISKLIADREKRKETLLQYKDEHELLDAYGWGFITEEEYEARLEAYGERLKELEARRKQDKTVENRNTEIMLWLEAFKEHTRSGDIMTDDDGTIMKALVESIIVKESSMEVRFKCGVSIEQEYVR